MQSKLDRAKYDYKKVKQENQKLTQENEILKDKVFGANEELNDYRRGNWWHWVFTWSLIFIIVLACCLCGGPNRGPLLQIAYRSNE